MKTDSLFGHLAIKFSSSPENLATESLLYILNQSLTAKQALIRYISKTGVNLDKDLLFQTQAKGSDQAIPDLVGINSQQQQVLIIEAKFWAGLTDNQPVTYLRRLPNNSECILMFLAPALRFQTLWAELIERCKRNNFIVAQTNLIDSELLSARINERQVLALGSWRSLLSVISQAANIAQDMPLASDVAQLEGLCNKMDTNAFVPLQSVELSSGNGMRISQYYQLIDDIVGELKKEKLATTGAGRNQLKSVGGKEGYGRYISLCGFAGYIRVSFSFWATRRETPFWLQLTGRDWKFSPQLKECLQFLERANPPRLFQDDYWSTIPLYIPVGAERDKALDDVLSQIREIALHISKL